MLGNISHAILEKNTYSEDAVCLFCSVVFENISRMPMVSSLHPAQLSHCSTAVTTFGSHIRASYKSYKTSGLIEHSEMLVCVPQSIALPHELLYLATPNNLTNGSAIFHSIFYNFSEILETQRSH